MNVTTCTSPPRSNTQASVSNITPYSYSKTNLIVFVEEGQSMYEQLVNDIRYYRKYVMNAEGLPKNQLHLIEEFCSPAPSVSSTDNYHTPKALKHSSATSKIDFTKLVISSPEFWASVIESTEAIENRMNSKKIFAADELASVVRCIDFTPTQSFSLDLPYVSSMVKRVKDRNCR